MPSQVAVRPSATQTNLVHDRRLTPKELYKQTKFLVKHNQLPPKLVVPGDSKYIPIFHTEDAKQIIQHRHTITRGGVLTMLFGFLGFSGSFVALLDSIVLFPGESIVMSALTAIGVSVTMLPAVRMTRTEKMFRKMSKRMNMEGAHAFAGWLKARYGIVESQEDSNRNHSNTYFAAGVWNNSHMGFTDDITGNKYEAHRDADGAVYLTLLSKGTKTQPTEAPTEVPVARQARLERRAKNEAAIPPAGLPQKAAIAQESLEAAITLLKEQDMSVEVAHQVERTERVAETVVAKYQHVSKLYPSTEHDQKLELFFKTQAEFIKHLLREHAEVVAREMYVEMSAATEATGMNKTVFEMR